MGVIGVFKCNKAAELVYYGLHALQHRGQEGCGICTTDGKDFYRERGEGLVHEIFDEKKLAKLKGNCAIGHVRYSSAGGGLDNVQPFISLINNGHYQEALKEYGVILKELAYLFFGNQSLKDDFTEYTFRIDEQMGLFWWYGSMLNSQHVLEWARSASRDALLAVLLLGICYLTNF